MKDNLNNIVKKNRSPDQMPIEHNRWVILLGGFLLSLMGGMSYAWGE